MQTARVLAEPGPHPSGRLQAASIALDHDRPGRRLFIDNVRWVMILLVLSMHAAVSNRFAARAAGACLVLAALMWLPLLAFGGALSGRQADYAGGLHWQSAALSLWESLVCVGMSFGVMALFRRRFAAQGRLSRFLSDNGFVVYVLHPPVLVGLAVWFAPLNLPPVAKFAVLWALGAVICFAIVAPLARRVPDLQRILQ